MKEKNNEDITGEYREFLSDLSYCKNCGTVIYAQQVNCSYCGIGLTDDVIMTGDEAIEWMKEKEKICGVDEELLSQVRAEEEEEKAAEEWDSGLRILKEKATEVHIPEKVKKICESIQDEVGDNEFSVLFKTKDIDEGFRVISDDYVIPKQEVTKTKVRYKENISKHREEEGYDCVIHSHPFSDDSTFSSSDNAHVNSHFKVSLLYSGNGEFTDARVLLELKKDETKVSLEPKIIDIIKILDIDTSNIKEYKEEKNAKVKGFPHHNHPQIQDYSSWRGRNWYS